MFTGGFAIWLTKSKNVAGLPSGFIEIAQGRLWIIPNALLIVILVLVVAHFLLSKTIWGRWFFAVGQNPVAARISGVPVKSVTQAAYVISGLSAALASILYTGRLETASPVMGRNLFLDVIAAVVIGGNSLFGGKGKVIWTVYGVLFIALVDNSLNLLGLSNFQLLMVKGAIILAAALLDRAKSGNRL
jgi:ribose/xylose/arabinose/galactoside ABC-type transport system permease subunit